MQELEALLDRGAGFLGGGARAGLPRLRRDAGAHGALVGDVGGAARVLVGGVANDYG